MDDVRNLSARQLDALREVANIGAGHAATALSQMTDETIMISVPRLAVSGVEELSVLLSASEEPVAAVLLHMVGDLKGLSVLTFSHTSAMRLVELMSRQPAGTFTEVGAYEQSAIQEAGNILSSAYLNALAEFMGMVLLPTPPVLAVGLSDATLADTVRAQLTSIYGRADTGQVSFGGSAFWTRRGRWRRGSISVVSALSTPPRALVRDTSRSSASVVALAYLPRSGMDAGGAETVASLTTAADTLSLDSAVALSAVDTNVWNPLERVLAAVRADDPRIEHVPAAAVATLDEETSLVQLGLVARFGARRVICLHGWTSLEMETRNRQVARYPRFAARSIRATSEHTTKVLTMSSGHVGAMHFCTHAAGKSHNNRDRPNGETA